MKMLSLSLALCAAMAFGISAMAEDAKPAAEAAQPAAVAAAPASTGYQGLTNPGACIGRGLANICTCWLEIPRCAIYDNSAVPFFGLIIGIPEGALFTVARALTGTVDIVSFGFTRDGIHGKSFPDFVWQAKWLSPESK